MTALGAVTGLVVVRLVAGTVGWSWSAPVLLVAAVTPAVLGVRRRRRYDGAGAGQPLRPARAGPGGAAAAAGPGLRRDRGRRPVRRGAAAARGVVGDDGGGGDLTAASAVTWMAVAGAVVLVRLTPPALRWMLRRTRRATGGVPLFVAARLVRSGARVLPVVVVVVAVSGSPSRQPSRPPCGTARPPAPCRWSVVTPGSMPARTRPSPRWRVTLTARPASVPPQRRGSRTVSTSRTAARRSSGWPWSTRPPTRLLLEASERRTRQGRRDCDPGRCPGSGAVPRHSLRPARRPEPAVGVHQHPPRRRRHRTRRPGRHRPCRRRGRRCTRRRRRRSAARLCLGSRPRRPRGADAVARTPGAAVTTYADAWDRRRDAALPSALGALAAASCALLLVLGLLGVTLAAATDAPSRATSIGRLRGDRLLRT